MHYTRKPPLPVSAAADFFHSLLGSGCALTSAVARHVLLPMKKLLSTLVMAGLVTGLVSTDLLAADQPKMRGAIEALQDAKTAEKPLPFLEEAKTHLKKAAKNKKGSRADAVQIVNEAIEEAKADDKDKMTQKINRAISEIHSGMDKAK